MDAKIFECFGSNERTSRAASRILAKKYDTESWNILLKEATSRNIDEVEPFYEELLATYPTCSRFWRTYIEHRMRLRQYDRVKELFVRCLEDVPSIEIFKCYLHYIKETKSGEPDTIYKSFRYTLDRVGIDFNSISIYNDYIQFLKDREVDSSYLDGAKIAAIRKAYQEGIMNPMLQVDQLWKEYLTFEKSVNASIAQKMEQERGREHTNVRRVAKEWEAKFRGVNRSWAATPPTFSADELRQVDIWRRYISWEKSNPLRVENNVVIMKRITYAYKQFSLCFGHHPNVYHEYASYLDEQIKFFSEKEPRDNELIKKLIREITQLFEKATKGLMKHSLLIHFAYADFEELRNDREKALSIYNNLIKLGQDNENIDLTLVYIQLMRFCRRTEGIKSARAIVKRGREDKRCGNQIYIAAALMEYQCTKDQAIACKIFELGLKRFSDCPEYILSYIHFMSSLNEENNTRVLFERFLTTNNLQSKDIVEIWNAFLEFESAIGDLSSITKVERRRAAALEGLFPDSTDTSWALDKYKFQDLMPCSVNELKSIGYDPQQSYTSLASLRLLMSKLTGSSSGLPQQVAVNLPGKKIKSLHRNQIGKHSNNGTSVDGFEQNDMDSEFTIDHLGQESMCMPDLDQMLPFKPVMQGGFGSHTVPGGIFQPPPAITNLLTRLPQPGSFWGPFVDIEELCNIIRMSDFDDLFDKVVEIRRDSSKQRVKKPRLD